MPALGPPMSRLLLAAPLLALSLLLPATTGMVATPAALPVGADHEHDHPDRILDTLLVAFEPSEQAALEQRVAALGAEVKFFAFIPGSAVVYTGEGRGNGVEEALRGLDGLVDVQHDVRTSLTYTPNDPRYTQQYGPQQISAPKAWDVTRADHSVKIAIMDTGIAFTHEDLAANICGSASFVPSAPTANDDFGHGTHVAGIAAAPISNAKGIAGMANACILAIKVLDGNGGGNFDWLVSGVNWAIGQGAKVITMSLSGCCNPGVMVENAMNAAWNAGIFIDGSAGNAGCPNVLGGQVLGLAGFSAGYPGAYSKVMAVASTSQGETPSVFSQCGPQVDLAAPGGNVLSTLPICVGGQPELCSNNGYGGLSGTSMSAPHIAGVAALMYAARPGITPREVFCFMIFTADQIAGPWDPWMGFGEVDAERAVLRARDGPPIGQGVNQFGQLETQVCNQATAPVSGISNLL